MKSTVRARIALALGLLLGLWWTSAPVYAQAAGADDAAVESLVAALREGGVVVLIRHSVTDPGAGDPPGFKHDDCPTQRNLSEPGREQARRLGEWFRTRGIVPSSVRASPWCRTRETARLAFGRSADWTALSNLYTEPGGRQEQTRQVRTAISAVGKGEVDVLVSHGVSIRAFVDVYPAQGEMVVVRPSGRAGDDGIEVVGRLLLP